MNRGNNIIEVTTRNVSAFTVWLHPRMIDVNKPLTIFVNGETGFAGMLKPSLLTALNSYSRRRDWGLIYPMKVELAVAAQNSSATP